MWYSCIYICVNAMRIHLYLRDMHRGCTYLYIKRIIYMYQRGCICQGDYMCICVLVYTCVIRNTMTRHIRQIVVHLLRNIIRPCATEQTTIHQG